MNMIISEKLEEQLIHLQEAITIAKCMVESYKKQNEEKSEEFLKLRAECQQLNSRIFELESKKCDACDVLQKKLWQLQKLNKNANFRLKSIASLLCSDEGGQTNMLTDVQWSRVTQILENSPRDNQEKKKKFTPLISEKEDLHSNNKQNSKIIVPETPEICDTRLQNVVGIVVPETQNEIESQYQKECSSETYQSISNSIGRLAPQDTLLENTGEKFKKHRTERLARSPLGNRMWTRLKEDMSATSHSKYDEQTIQEIETVKPTEKELNKLVDQTEEKIGIHTRQESTNNKVQESNSYSHTKRELSFDKISQKTKSVVQKDSNSQKNSEMKKETAWKLKPSLLIKSSISDNQNKCSKRKLNLKQTTLSVSAIDKKQDISTLENFNGGVANSCTEENDNDSDVIFDSPKNKKKIKVSNRRQLKLGTKDLEETLFQPPSTSTCLPQNEVNCKSAELTLKLETNDLDETLFRPPITSTCISLSSDNSYDRLPDLPKNPDYKHKKVVVRKKEERMKLPGWSCNECYKYYKISGESLSKEEIKQKMNACSRHRDKNQLRPKTPPGFWDPVIPPS